MPGNKQRRKKLKDWQESRLRKRRLKDLKGRDKSVKLLRLPREKRKKRKKQRLRNNWQKRLKKCDSLHRTRPKTRQFPHRLSKLHRIRQTKA